MMKVYKENPSLFWEIAFVNLSYNSYIVQWFCTNIATSVIYNAKTIEEEISSQGFAGSLSTVGNASIALLELMKKSPIGYDLMQGIVVGKEGLQRNEYEDLSIEALAYSIYKFAKQNELSLFRVSDLYKSDVEHGVYREFLLSRQNLMKKLRVLSADRNRVLIAELSMGLEHITLRDDLTPQKVLEALAL